MEIAFDPRPFGDDDVGFRLHAALDDAVDVQPAAAGDIARYGRAGGDDGGMACAAMWLVSAMKDSHGTCLTFLKMVV